MTRTALDEARDRVRALPHPLVAFLGPPCRTWYSDMGQVETVMVALNFVRNITAVHNGALPFATGVEEIAKAYGIKVFCVDAKLMLDTVDLIVAFPREDGGVLPSEGKSKAKRVYGVETADPSVAMAVQFGIPVLGVRREGDMTWSTDSESSTTSRSTYMSTSKWRASKS